MISPRIIVALDFSDRTKAINFVAKLDTRLCRIKVGKELFTIAGPLLIEKLMKLGFEIFLGLKFHDIPNTVAAACSAAAGLRLWLVNVYALGGRKTLVAARNALQGKNKAYYCYFARLNHNDPDEVGIYMILPKLLCSA